MAENTACACSVAPKLIFPCSGGSDVGAVSDQAARKLTREGAGKMYCLAGIGGRVTGITETTKSAAKELAIDGCEQDCARKTLELAGFTQFSHLRLSDFGMEKGKTPPNDANIGKAATNARGLARAHPVWRGRSERHRRARLALRVAGHRGWRGDSRVCAGELYGVDHGQKRVVVGTVSGVDWRANVFQRGWHHPDCASVARQRRGAGYGAGVYDVGDCTFVARGDHLAQGAKAPAHCRLFWRGRSGYLAGRLFIQHNPVILAGGQSAMKDFDFA